VLVADVVAAAAEPSSRRSSRRFNWLFLHGFGSGRDGGKATQMLAHASARGDAAMRFDQRFHGESTGELAHIRLQPMIEDAADVLLHVASGAITGLGAPCVVIGSSLGGLVAAAAAARTPQSVAMLGLVAPAFGWFGRLTAAPRDDDGRLVVRNEWLDVRLDPELVDREAGSIDEDALATELAAVPVRVFHGVRDDVVPIAASRRWTASRPTDADTQLVEFAEGEHRLEIEMPEILAHLDAALG
jgi:pimeloyl-ACP methyl ester carboxylesterase